MRCSKCDSKTKVIDSRKRKGYNYRRRKCLGCQREFVTHESEIDSGPIVEQLNEAAEHISKARENLQHIDAFVAKTTI